MVTTKIKSRKRSNPEAFSLWIFRYFSNRGTDQTICVKLKQGTLPSDALEIAKDWAYKYAAGTACYEYTVTAEPVRHAERDVLLRRWNKVCKQHNAIVRKRNNLRAQLAAFDLRVIQG